MGSKDKTEKLFMTCHDVFAELINYSSAHKFYLHMFLLQEPLVNTGFQKIM